MRRPLRLLATTCVALLARPLTSSAASAATGSVTYVIPSASAFDGSTSGPSAGSATVTLPLRRGTGPDGNPVGYRFSGGVDFSLQHVLVAGPASSYFPPQQ